MAIRTSKALRAHTPVNRGFPYLFRLAFLFLFYVATGLFGLKLDAISGFASLVWFPTAISFVGLYLFGYRMLPAVFAAAFVVNNLNGAPTPVALGIAFGNSLEAFTAVYLLRKFGFRRNFGNLRNVIAFVLIAGVLAAIVSASIGVASLYYGGIVSGFFVIQKTWFAWWLGDSLSNLVITPVLLTWSLRARPKASLIHAVEFTLLLILVFLIGYSIFSGFLGLKIGNPSLTYLVFPPIIWAALRFSQREIATITFVFVGLAVVGTALGYGPFAFGNISESLIPLECFSAVIAVTSLIMGGALAERREFEKRKDDFISMASHELKSPLTSLKIFTELLAKNFTKKNNRQAFKYLGRMDQQVNRVTHLVNDLLNLTKIQAKKIDIRREYFSLDALLKEIVVDMQAASKGHAIILSGRLGTKLFGDRERVEQVLINLISNAVKYSPGAKKVLVRVEKTKKMVVVHVQDFGVGISRDDQKKVFGRFFRSESGTPRASGLGIGLYISKSIVESHGGEIWVESVRKKGSTFSFSLPLGRKQLSN